MSIKDLFDKGHSLKFAKNKTKDDLSENVESYRYIDAYAEERNRFVPDIDFTTASNFARFGLAEEYYDASIKRVYQTYPYDGSQAEKIEWKNDSTYLDLFLFENEYPRTNGYITMGQTSSFVGSIDSKYNIFSSSTPQYVFIKGGPHPDPNADFKSDFSAGYSKIGISKANIYHTASQRTSNLELDLSNGVTVEFWLKKDGWAPTANNQDEFIFHLWNSGSVLNDAPSNGTLYLTASGKDSTSKKTIYTHILSGSTTITASHDTGLSDIADGNWHHYALTAKTQDSETISNLYVDGVHVSQKTDSDTINALTGAMMASIGGLAGPLTGSSTIGKGWGNIVSASYDEFRYWKTERNAQQIGRFYRDQVGGGTNTDNAKYDDVSNKVDLGVYYKFNEGITGVDSTDSTILDYSGRISNGDFVNYSSGDRNTGSAIVLSNAADKEFKDPILYSTHSDIIDLVNSKQLSGSVHDHENTVSLYKSLPSWITEEDEEQSGHLKYLTQVIASYFDDLYLQIQKLSRLKDINYPNDLNYDKPLPFADRLLNSRNYIAPELFAGASDLAKYLERDEKILFEKKLYEVKNIIYQNLYNNLSYIQKSKGTFKSLRNFLRCFGVGEELIKLNVYSNNDIYEFKDNEAHVSIRKKYLDFDDLETKFSSSGGHGDGYTATAYQYYDSSDPNSLSYIPAATESLLTGAMITIETEVIFPKRSIVGDDNYNLFPTTGSSIFGLHAVIADNENLAFDATDTVNFNVIAIKPDNDLRNVKFALESSGSSVFADLRNTSSFAGVYDNEKWNLAFRLRPTKARTDAGPFLNTSTGFLEPAASAYTYELYGVNYLSNILRNEFVLSGTISLTEAETFFTKPKRIFLGAARTNFTGSVERYSDVKVSSTRLWLDYLPDEVIRAHARDANSYGALQPYRNANDSLNTNYVPQISTLILNWTMDNVTGSNASGQFSIQDFASGSNNDRLRFGDGWAKPLSKYNYAGRGDKFTADANLVDQAVDVEFVQSAKLKLPEVANSDDMIKILSKQDEVVFTRDTTYIQHLLSIEKSMYQVVSEEMLRIFATVTDFNNLVGEPVNRYRPHYKKIEKLRELFFESVENERLDLEKFVEYFKWIDDAVTIMIAQLVPVSSNSVELLRNVVESHILERNKYHNKFPTLEIKPHKPVYALRGIEELKYNWKFGHAPVNASQNTNQDQSCLWWKQRAERDGVLTSGVSAVDSDKNTTLKISITEVSGTTPTLKKDDGTRYAASYFQNRSLSRPIDLITRRSLKLKGGSNSQNNNIHDFYKSIIKWGSDDDFIYLDTDNEINRAKCNDQEIPPEIDKKEFVMKALIMPANETIDSNKQGSGGNDLQYTDAKSTLLLPFGIFSSSIDTGYRRQYKAGTSTMPKIEFANMHEDKYGPHAEIPLQGPFTEKYVGGMQHRHVELNKGSDEALTRPEGWHLQQFVDSSADENIIRETFSGVEISNGASTTDVGILDLPIGSISGDPGVHEKWINGATSENSWTFFRALGAGTGTPSVGTGPGTSLGGSVTSLSFAYCEVLPGKVGQTFDLITPLIDALDIDSRVRLKFTYHMFGTHIGTLKVQASTDPAFPAGNVEDIAIISGQQQTDSGIEDPHGAFGRVHIDSSGDVVVQYGQGGGVNEQLRNGLGGTKTLTNFINKRFYIRFLYTAGIGHLGDCALGEIKISKETGTFSGGDPGFSANSFRLMDPTHDNHHRPSAIYTRDILAKRPVNIRNIEMTASSPTKAGNYLDRYEYISTMSPEANDPWFVKNVDTLTRTTSELLGLGTGSIETILNTPPGTIRTDLQYLDYTLADRDYLTGSTRNRTRFRTKFSSPGGFEVSSRGFLDVAHEIYSVYNAMPWRNNWSRKVHNSQLQAHMGRFGASAHEDASAATATITVADGDAASGMAEKEHITIVSTDDTSKRYVITNAASDGSTATGTVLSDDDNTDTGSGTAGADEDGGIAVSINLSSATQNDYLVQLKAAIEHANGHNGKIIVSSVPTEANGNQSITLTQAATTVNPGLGINITNYGRKGNTTITTDISQLTISSFTGGQDSVARTYGSETVGTINSADYTITGGSSKHKYHRNNIERIEFTGDDPRTEANGGPRFITGSIKDNAFVSHMIPRSDKQARWITGSLI